MASLEVGVLTLVASVNNRDECDAPVNPEIEAKEMEALEVIKEDICKWLAKIMQISIDITPTTFMEMLDNGVLLCKLAATIQAAAGKVQSDGDKEIPNIPSSQVKCNERAGSKSFQARDNVSNFINWCRKLGVEEAVIFESEGVVLHKDEKRVILCLLAVARFAYHVGISPPELVRMEREIDELDSGELSQDTPVTTTSADTAQSSGDFSGAVITGAEQSINVYHHHSHPKQSELSRKVMDMLTRCSCSNQALEVKDCGSGKFIINGGRIRSQKTLYARLLSDRIMVRIGGGWDSLEHFLLVHDPCRVKKFILLTEGPNEAIVMAHMQTH